jgi:hypothetical protein
MASRSALRRDEVPCDAIAQDGITYSKWLIFCMYYGSEFSGFLLDLPAGFVAYVGYARITPKPRRIYGMATVVGVPDQQRATRRQRCVVLFPVGRSVLQFCWATHAISLPAPQLGCCRGGFVQQSPSEYHLSGSPCQRMAKKAG